VRRGGEGGVGSLLLFIGLAAGQVETEDEREGHQREDDRNSHVAQLGARLVQAHLFKDSDGQHCCQYCRLKGRLEPESTSVVDANLIKNREYHG